MQSLEERTVVALEGIAAELKRANDAMERDNDRLVSCKEAAEICGVRVQTISAWIRKGRIHKCFRNGRTGILLSELNRN